MRTIPPAILPTHITTRSKNSAITLPESIYYISAIIVVSNHSKGNRTHATSIGYKVTQKYKWWCATLHCTPGHIGKIRAAVRGKIEDDSDLYVDPVCIKKGETQHKWQGETRNE